jgi:hypothetical protein
MGQASSSSAGTTGIQTSGNLIAGPQNNYTSILVALIVVVLVFAWMKKGR